MPFWDFLKKKKGARQKPPRAGAKAEKETGAQETAEVKPIEIAGKTKYHWSKDIIWGPILTEKGQRLTQRNTVVFKVAPTANKTELKEAIEKIFNVKVVSVRTEKVKKRERGRLKIRSVRPNFKKAYVRLQEGGRIPIFE